MKFFKRRQAQNQHLCGLGDSIVDVDYKDGGMHHFFHYKNQWWYASKDKQATAQNSWSEITYTCADYNQLYEGFEFPQYNLFCED